METQAHRAGPERSRQSARAVRMEAAGPACPRLRLEEVRLSVSANSTEARVTLGLGPHRFTGAAAGHHDGSLAWQLAAAATVTAIQRYLQQSRADHPAPRVQLADLATTTTGTGRAVIHATIKLVHGTSETHLLGSALVRNDWCSTAVAAALDATSRRLASLALSPLTLEAEGDEQALASLDRRPAALPSVGRGDRPESEMAAPSPPTSALAHHRSESSVVTLGVEIGAGAIRAAAVDASGRKLAEAHRPGCVAAEPEPTLAVALEAASAAAAALHSSTDGLARVGLAISGRLRAGDGVCISSHDFPAWREVQLTAPFAQEFHLPVSLIGAADAAALAEVGFGAAKGLSHVLLVRLAREITVAAISEGRPVVLGEVGPGQAGHMVIAADGPRCRCGDSGCWQALAGTDSLISRVIRDIGRGVPTALLAAAENRAEAITPELICRLAAGGDALARSALEETGRYLAIGLANLVTLFDPEAILVDSAPSPVGVALRQAAEKAIKTSARGRLFSRCVLLSPALGEAAAVLGAAAWAAHQAAHA